MKLSMWTLYDWLEKQGMEPLAKITDGQPLIEGVRFYIPQEESGENAEVLAAEEKFTAQGFHTVLRFGQDQILLPCANAAAVHNQALQAFHFFHNWEKELLLCMLDRKNLQDLLNIAHRAFQRPMFIKSDGSWIYAITREYDKNVHPVWALMHDNLLEDRAEFNSVKAVSLDPEYQTVFKDKHPGIYKSPYYSGEVLHANIWLGERRIGEIIAIAHGKPFNPGDTHLMSFFTQTVQRVIQEDSPLYLSYSGISAFFMDILETKSFDIVSSSAVLHTLGWLKDDELVVICIAIQASHDTPVLSVMREKFVDQFKYGCAFSYLGHVICIANTRKAGGIDPIIQQAEKLIPHEIFTWGASYEFCGLENFAAYYRQALCVLLLARQDKKPYYTMHEVAFKMMTGQIQNLPDFDAYIHPDIRRLREADEKGNSHYVNTLFQYLLCGGNMTDTANILGLHRNSLIYRINRICDIIGSDLNNTRQRRLLLMSFLFGSSAE